MRVNVRSLYVFTRAVDAAHGRRRAAAASSTSRRHGAAHETTPFMPPGYLVYSVAKAALERFTSAAAPELAPLGIAINALRPGAVKTEMTAIEFGADADWSGWATPDSVVAAGRGAWPLADADFTGRVLDVAGFGQVRGLDAECRA